MAIGREILLRQVIIAATDMLIASNALSLATTYVFSR